MRTKFLFFVLLFSIALPYQSIPKKEIDSPKLKNEYQIKLDTLRVQNFTKESAEKKWYETNNISWGVSLLISIVTIIVSWRVTVRNNKNSKEVALDQIKNSKELALTEFKATLNSKNRQDWINEVRHSLSEYIIQNRMLNIEYQNKNSTNERIQIHYEKAGYNYNKIFLLLNHNPTKEEHKKLLNLIRELSGLIDTQMLQSPHRNDNVSWNNIDELKKRNHAIITKEEEILKVGMELLYFEWQKIQNMENK